jgi:hypothetical protein
MSMQGQLEFTDHALVRYIERHVDPGVVRSSRRQGLGDREILAVLNSSHAEGIQMFVERARHVYEERSMSWRNVMDHLTYTLRLGHVPLRIASGVCVTVLTD